MSGLLHFLARLPLPILRMLALWAAWLVNLLPHTGMRWVVRVNLLLGMPHLSESERLALERVSVRSQCLTALESIKCWGMPPDYSIGQIREVHGFEQLQAALANPKGMIAVVPHLGTWEMMNAWLNQFGAPVIMYKPADQPELDQFMLAARQRLNATLVPTDERGVRAIFKALKQGGFTIILPDHVPETSGGVMADFFGIETLTSTLVSKLAQKTGCSVLGLSCLRRDDLAGFDVYCDLFDAQVADKDLNLAVSVLNQEMKRMIARAPEQYLWSYRRFKVATDLDGLYRWDEDKVRQVAQTRSTSA
ncbi:MAG: lysophospholipid acyltransferase family protein [Pseudomonadota bacterium]|nr:lysophospholipid acyltransferase family protein [Pseudomonadota bacterium]